MKTSQLMLAAALAVVAVGTAGVAHSLEFDQNVTPDAIFGSGNDNGAFTTDRQNGVELGLRAKLRFNAANLPENTFNSNGDGTYSFAAILPPMGFGFCPFCPTTPIWNFEWSVNTDFDDSSGLLLDDLTYELSMDFDPACSVGPLVFDPITPAPPDVPCFDHALGDNSTPNGGGMVSPCADYPMNLGLNNVAQNSWSYEFFNEPPFDTFDPTDDGTYDITLTAFDGMGDVVASTTIQVIVGAGGLTSTGQPCPQGCCDPCDLRQLAGPVDDDDPCFGAPAVSDPPPEVCCDQLLALTQVLPRNAISSTHPCLVMAP